MRAGKDGIERVHIIDGREEQGLLGEVFSNEGIGTLVYANEYQSIRPAMRKDVRAVFHLIQQGVQADELVKRTRADVERQIGDFFVFEVDRNPVACVALHPYPEQTKGELASVYVDDRYENQGIGGEAHRLRRGQARPAGCRDAVLPFDAGVSTTSFKKAGSASARPTTCPRHGASGTTQNAPQFRRCW